MAFSLDGDRASPKQYIRAELQRRPAEKPKQGPQLSDQIIREILMKCPYTTFMFPFVITSCALRSFKQMVSRVERSIDKLRMLMGWVTWYFMGLSYVCHVLAFNRLIVDLTSNGPAVLDANITFTVKLSLPSGVQPSGPFYCTFSDSLDGYYTV